MTQFTYDLTRCVQGYNGKHATSVMGNGTPTDADMLKAAESIRIPRTRAMEIIRELRMKINNEILDYF